MRRVADAGAKLQKLALGMRNAGHQMRPLLTGGSLTTIVIGPKLDMQQCHKPTFPGPGSICAVALADTFWCERTCILNGFELKLYSVEVKRRDG